MLSFNLQFTNKYRSTVCLVLQFLITQVTEIKMLCVSMGVSRVSRISESGHHSVGVFWR